MEQKSLSLYDEHSHRDQRTLVLDRLRRDHRCIGACIEVLEHRLQVQRIYKGAASFTEKLIDQLLDAPDEFHHHLERSAYHRLCARIGQLVPDALDLVKHQDEIRERRCDICASVMRPRLGIWTAPIHGRCFGIFAPCDVQKLSWKKNTCFHFL